jgi:RNA-binding protein
VKQNETTIGLTGKQKRHLRGLGHGLKPVIMIGKKEVDQPLVAETEAALAHHELIKVKVLENCPLDRHEAAETLSEATGSNVAQVLGKTFLLYRPAEKPVIVLPAGHE